MTLVSQILVLHYRRVVVTRDLNLRYHIGEVKSHNISLKNETVTMEYLFSSAQKQKVKIDFLYTFFISSTLFKFTVSSNYNGDSKNSFLL